MPNIGTLLRDEITRLSRRSLRNEVGSTKKASAQHRRQIAALKRQVAQLERQVAMLARRLPQTAAAPAAANGTQRFRFAAKGLRAHRERLGLSAEDFGRLIGVSGQSVYNWERESARPRDKQIAQLATLRGLGKREAMARLEQMTAQPKAKARKRRAQK
jgi:DNA-binding transcriptional regulator YiaG